MKLFENKVGRPTNEIIKKRRMFYFMIVICIMLTITISTGLLSKTNINGLLGAVSNSCNYNISATTSSSVKLTYNCKDIKKIAIYNSDSNGNKRNLLVSKKVRKSGSYEKKNLGSGKFYIAEFTIGSSVKSYWFKTFDTYYKSESKSSVNSGIKNSKFLIKVEFLNSKLVNITAKNALLNIKYRPKQCIVYNESKGSSIAAKFTGMNKKLNLSKGKKYYIECTLKNNMNVGTGFVVPTKDINIIEKAGPVIDVVKYVYQTYKLNEEVCLMRTDNSASSCDNEYADKYKVVTDNDSSENKTVLLSNENGQTISYNKISLAGAYLERKDSNISKISQVEYYKDLNDALDMADDYDVVYAKETLKLEDINVKKNVTLNVNSRACKFNKVVNDGTIVIDSTEMWLTGLDGEGKIIFSGKNPYIDVGGEIKTTAIKFELASNCVLDDGKIVTLHKNMINPTKQQIDEFILNSDSKIRKMIETTMQGYTTSYVDFSSDDSSYLYGVIKLIKK